MCSQAWMVGEKGSDECVLCVSGELVEGESGRSGLIIINHFPGHMFIAATQIIVRVSDFNLGHSSARTACVSVTGEV